MSPLDEILNQITAKWPLLIAGLVSFMVLSAAFLFNAISEDITEVGMLAILLAASSGLKYPGRFSSVGGMDLDAVTIILVASAKGLAVGGIFASLLIIIGRKINPVEPPHHTAITYLTYLVLALVAERVEINQWNLMWVGMALLTASVLALAPLKIATGAPPKNMMLASATKIALAYVFLKVYGTKVLEALA